VVPIEEPAGRPGRRRPRRSALTVGGVLVALAVAGIAIASLKSSSGGSGHGSSSTSGSGRATHGPAPAGGSNPASIHVAVLNGTNTTGLAHRLSASLQQSGYSQAVALDGTPPGEHQTSVVEYAPGDGAEAKRVAQDVGVSQVQPLEAAVGGLATGASVVVIAGLDKAGTASAGGEAVP
jgi:LytR cell envelope-related transcriptional attenuator